MSYNKREDVRKFVDSQFDMFADKIEEISNDEGHNNLQRLPAKEIESIAESTESLAENRESKSRDTQKWANSEDETELNRASKEEDKLKGEGKPLFQRQ